MAGWNLAGSAWQDTRFALRMMRRAPGFTAVAVLSLAVGIGANTAIFSLIDAAMLRLLPVREPERLVELLHRFPGEPHLNGSNWQAYQYYLAQNRSLSDLMATGRAPNPRGSWFRVRTAGAEAEKVDGVYVTGNFFPGLGVEPALGRLIGPEDDRLEAPAPVAVVSWAFWNSRFQRDPSILGKQLIVEDVPVTIVGVAARNFAGWQVESREDLWLPLAVQTLAQPEQNYTKPQGGGLTLVGRLRPGVTIDQARAEYTVLYRHVVEEDKSGGRRFLAVMKAELEPAGAGLAGPRDGFARPLVVLMIMVGLLLAAACANVAGLLLARGTARQRELAMRAALGASRPRLALQAITESLLLSSAGAAAGILLAYLGTGVLTRIIAGGREPVELRVSPDARVLGFTIAVTIFSGLLFGLAPAWRAWRTAPASPLRDAGRAGDSALRRLFGRSLVVAQVALSVALLAGTGLFTGHLANLYAGLGFERDHVLIVTLDPSKTGYKRADLAGPYRDLLERLEAIPGVRSATLSGMTPISGAGANRDAKVEGYQPAPGELRYLPMNIVGPRYFETYGTPLEAGRDFRFSDQGGSRVAIVNRAFARHYYAGGNPIGKHVLFDGDDRPYEIVGMVGDAKYRDPGEAPGRTIYLNCFQDGKLYSHFSIRARGAPESVAAGVRRTVRETLPALRVEKVTTLAEQVNAAMVPERLIAMLSRWFGATAALLAAVGLYGLLAYSVARRTSEIGVRMALGATPGDVIRNVVGGAFALVIAGLLAGLPAALWGKRFAVALIPELRASIAASLALAVATLLAIAAVAAWAPARRAARVDPAEALRRE